MAKVVMSLTLAGLAASVALAGCAGTTRGPELPSASFGGAEQAPGDQYIIGPLDELTVFVWRNPELSSKVQVRPDGRITTPLIADLPAVGKTPAQLADDIKGRLTTYIQDPLVSVIVEKFNGTFSQQIRVVGATAKPASLPYRANMTLLDAMIEVGGLSEFAAGDRATLVRRDRATGSEKEYRLRIAQLLKRGDRRANVKLEPGDVIIIPESSF